MPRPATLDPRARPVLPDRLRTVLPLAVAPVPLFLLQPALERMVRHVAGRRPQLFARIGANGTKRLLIDPTNLPFVVLLQPHPERPRLGAFRRRNAPAHDARIAGTLLTLLDMVDGRLDGDALFFSRELSVQGDTEAVVALRNALDDTDGSVADDAAEAFGPPGTAILSTLRSMSRARQRP